MSTTTHDTLSDFGDRKTPIAPIMAKRTAARAMPLVGRILFAFIFVASAPGHFTEGMIAYAASAGLPLANVLVPLSGIIALAGGLSVMLGFHAKWGAALLILFLLPVTLTMHAFWSVSDPQLHQMQLAMFMKNVSMIGGALVIAYFGAGPMSLDARSARRATETPF